MGAAGRLDGDHGKVALQRGLGHPVSGPQAGLGRRGAGQQQGQLHRALQAASELCLLPFQSWDGTPIKLFKQFTVTLKENN